MGRVERLPKYLKSISLAHNCLIKDGAKPWEECKTVWQTDFCALSP